jgi:hypothetical protein
MLKIKLRKMRSYRKLIIKRIIIDLEEKLAAITKNKNKT